MVTTPAQITSRSRRSTSCQAVLATLKSAYPDGVDTMTLIDRHGPSAQSRVGDLVEDGWSIDADRSGTVAVYRLTSLVRGAEDPAVAGCILRLGPTSGWQARTHASARSAKVVPADVLAEAESEAAAAYKAVLTRRGFGHLLGRAEAQEDETDPCDGYSDYLGDDQDDDTYDCTWG